jgi:hypothetical protein
MAMGGVWPEVGQDADVASDRRLDGAQAQSDIRFPPALCAAIVDLRCVASWNTNVGLRFAPSNLRLTHPTLARIEIDDSKHLLSEGIPMPTSLVAEQSQADFNIDINMEELDMLFFALPDAIPQLVYQDPIIVAANASKPLATVRKMTYGVCEFFSSYDERRYTSAEISDSGHPLGVTSFMHLFLPREMQDSLYPPSPDIDWKWFGEWTESFKITLLRAPKHGKFMNMKNTPYGQYLPDLNYIGKDRIDLLVEGKDDKGRPIAMTMRYYINVLPQETDLSKIIDEGGLSQLWKELCGTEKGHWRISGDQTGSDLAIGQGGPDLSAQVTSVLLSDDPTNWYETASLQSLLMGAKDALTGFADFPGASLGQTLATRSLWTQQA